MSVPSKQIRQALDALSGAAGKPPKKLKLKVDEPVEDEVITWESMEIDKARAEAAAFPVEDQIKAMKEADEYANAIEYAQGSFQNKELVYSGGKVNFLPPSVINPVPLKTAVGPAWNNLYHWNESSVETMALIAQGQGRGNTYLTSMTDETVHTMSATPNAPAGSPSIFKDTMTGYEFDNGFESIPTVAARVLDNGDVEVEGIVGGWNEALLLAGNGANPNNPKNFPLLLRFNKPLFETKHLSGKVLMNGEPLSINLEHIKNLRQPKRAKGDAPNFASPYWMDATFDEVPPEQKAALLFQRETQLTGVHLAGQGVSGDALKAKNLQWEQSANEVLSGWAPATNIESDIARSVQSYYPRFKDGTAFFDRYFPPKSIARQAVLDYTKNSPYKARLVDKTAPKDHPILIFRGEQGPQLVDKEGNVLDMGPLDPRNALETGLNMGSLWQAEMFAIRGAGPQWAKMGRDRTISEEFLQMQDAGERILNKIVRTKPELTKLWDQFIDTIVARTKWGQTSKAQTFADDVGLRIRPKHADIQRVVTDLWMNDPQFAPLFEAFKGGGPLDQGVVNAMSLVTRDAANIHVFVANFSKPLVMIDQGGFSARRVLNQMLVRPEFVKDIPDIQDALSYADDMHLQSEQGFSNIANHMLRDIMKKHGYDHIAYTNTVEFPGTPSFVAVAPGSVRPIGDFGGNLEAVKLMAAAPIALTLAQVATKEETKEDDKDKEGD